MKNITIAAAVTLLSIPLLAQGSMTTPPGGLTREGDGHTLYFAWFPNARFQQVDGMHTGKAASITEIAFRLDYQNHTSDTTMGRSWTRITLDISETTNYSGMSQTWSQNITTTPTRVFDSKWSWPTYTGFPPLKPTVWGGTKGRLRFPFTNPWSYTGKNEILMDYVFRGGRLDNNALWSASYLYDFPLDCAGLLTHQNWGTYETLLQNARCADSAITLNAAAITFGYTCCFGAAHPTVALRNRVVVAHFSNWTAPGGAPVVHAVGLGGTTGIEVGARCNPLYVDFNKPVALVSRRMRRIDRAPAPLRCVLSLRWSAVSL